MGSTLYLKKLNNDLVCWCNCPDGLVDTPAQADCPWCGCGWLFTCLRCRKAFTFARAVPVDETLEQLARRAAAGRPASFQTEEAVADWIEWMRLMLKGVRPGGVYVYFDGHYLDAGDRRVNLEGWHSKHDLPYIPQVQALRDPSVEAAVLTNRQYWLERRIERDDNEDEAS